MDQHKYVSTACQHDLHEHCRKTCKFCNARCLCPCHENEQPPRPGEPLDGTDIDVVLTTPSKPEPECRGCGWGIGETHAIDCRHGSSNRLITPADCEMA